MLTNAFALYMRILNKRVLYALVFLMICGIVMSYPNPISHECVPNNRTLLGVTSEGYTYDKAFCDDGYYPELRWGLEDSFSSTVVTVFMVFVPLLLLSPIVYIAIAKRHQKKSFKS